ncbi:hypothetical protein T440DRAFT_469392 [Plenodomus tracheiphilus IPT5]|uniref:Phosphatidylinositol glycan, class Q n=1 Tax=Plenodomus tracheiphilus IPT5 TaxID=1408161 RepID=A0A6A7B4P1_9PLEO|nr:hypothetical protein T440DRAFT_469392 [Plenodomus tracheiphilus IPT5]
MHAFSIVTIGIFVAGYSTARWDLATRLYELAIFAWDHGVVARTAKGFAILSLFFVALVLPVARIAARETDLVSTAPRQTVCTRLTLAAPSPRRHWHICTRAAQATWLVLVG